MRISDEFVNVNEWLVLAGRLRGFETPLGAVVEPAHFEDHDCAILWDHVAGLAEGDSVADLYNAAGLYGREPLTSRAAVILCQLGSVEVSFDRFSDAAWDLVREDAGEMLLGEVRAGKGPTSYADMGCDRFVQSALRCGGRRRAPQSF